MLSESRKKIIDQNKTRLRHVIKFVEFCGRQERISKKQDGRLVGRTASFRGEYSQLFIYKLRPFLDYSNYKHFFLFKVFASITSAPPLRKILAAPLSGYCRRSAFLWLLSKHGAYLCYRKSKANGVVDGGQRASLPPGKLNVTTGSLIVVILYFVFFRLLFFCVFRGAFIF